MEPPYLIVVGGGLAGCEAAWQAAQRGLTVYLYEMRPQVMTGAHVGPHLAELVCSNSLGSDLPDSAAGLLKRELRRLGSLLLRCAENAAVPAGGALAVDRQMFAEMATQEIKRNNNIHLIRQEVIEIPEGPAVIASGPLTSPRFSGAIAALTGQHHLYFFDAIAPIVTADSVNMNVAYRGSRYGRGEQNDGDYINCPLEQDQYEAFVDALVSAERIKLHTFEQEVDAGVNAGGSGFFEGCLPIEVLAQRGRETLAFGPMRPVGLVNPHTGRRPYAVVQLRQDNLIGTLYNLVGFQTNLTFPEQRRVLRMIPGLDRAEFVRFGQMHRNTFIFSPALLRSTLQFRDRDDLFFAGQITGVEGYVGNMATGLLAGWNAARIVQGLPALSLPETTMLGALCRYVTKASKKDFQPMKANFGLLPVLKESPRGRGGKRQRGRAFAERALTDLEAFIKQAEE